MFRFPILWAPLFLLSFCCAAAGQVMSFPASGAAMSPLDAIQRGQLDMSMLLVASRNPHTTEVQSPDSSLSRLDLKAPGKAQHEYAKGYRLLMRNNLENAVEHLSRAIAFYSQFVAAHNALGSAYLKLGQNEQASNEFNRAIALDDHLPNSYLNLGCAELALKRYGAAEASFRKASAIAPLELQLKLALAYGEFANHNYPAVIATAHEVHAQKHDGAAVVHFFAAGAWEAQGNLKDAQQELETLLQEDPKSDSAAKFREILQQVKTEEVQRSEARLRRASATVPVSKPAEPSPEELERRRQFALQQKQEENQIAEAQAAPDPSCVDCAAGNAAAPADAPEADAGGNHRAGSGTSGTTLRINVNEVSVLFAATDHGRPVTDLAATDIALRDDGKPPEAVVGFRNESQLPLRLALVVDTSDSVAARFSFELAAAARFLQETALGADDLAFVVGVNNVVLLAQDFTADQTLTSHALEQLAPSGGTNLWDAVAFAADKLAGHPETQPVARILVVISDGQDNSSSIPLKQAIAHAQRGDVAVYTVSTSDEMHEGENAKVGDRALSTLAELTGGASFVPGSVRFLNKSLADLQQVIRSRYLISYKPARFQSDGKYRSIGLDAERDGRKLKIFARKGYYASTEPADSNER